MNKLQLFRLLRRHLKLAEKRSPIYEQNRWAKLFVYSMGGLAIIYLVIIAVAMALEANTTSSCTPCEFFFSALPFILTFDFFARFIAQHTPAQMTKPYSLLPVSKYACVECFIFSSIISADNLVWMALTIPYTIMSVLFSEGFPAAAGLVLSCHLFVIVNSQWYMLARTLINHSMAWWLLPAGVYALVYLPLLSCPADTFFTFFASWGNGFCGWHILPWLGAVSVLVAFILANREIQYRLTYLENSNGKDKTLNTVTELNSLDKYGETGEYLKIEIKSLMRNKNVRRTFIFGLLFVMVLSLVISTTNLYDDSFTRIFWVVYTFVLLGAMLLVKIMCAEGNYIDGLMVHRENIYRLLRAKYYFYSVLLLIPFSIMLPTVFTGKYSLLMLTAMMCFAAGPVYCVFMQMAVYNRQTMPLNTKYTGRANFKNNFLQLAVEMLVMFAPVALISILRLIVGETATYVVLLATGIVFICTHKLWIRNIYNRFMLRRYKNMEGFRNSR